MDQKVSTLTDSNWGEKFGNKGLSALSGFMSSYNVATQTLSFTGANPVTSGGAACCVNGVYIPALTAEADADWDSSTSTVSVEGDAKGVYIPDLYSAYIAVFADADGRLKIDMAGDVLLDTPCVTAGVKINWFDPSEYVCIGVVLVNSTGVTLGTTTLSGLTNIYQVTGSMLPHPDNLQI